MKKDVKSIFDGVDELHDELESHAQAIKKIVSEIKTHILSLPDNPKIKRISSNPKCFVINSKNLSNNWSVEHHDFKKQYELIVKELENTQCPFNIFDKLQKIISEGKIVICNFHKNLRISNTLILHPDVISYLNKLVNNKVIK